MGKITIANLKKTIDYLRRNGLKETLYAARERLSERQAAPYVYAEPTEEELERQRAQAREAVETDGGPIRFSIVVPTYHTARKQLEEMITSVIKQSYPYWELILADATQDDSVKDVVDELLARVNTDSQYGDGAVSGNVRYLRLPQNGGIAENTNEALQYAEMEYVGLLDHDDLLTPDALYEMAEAIRAARTEGIEAQLLYSDEDKCNADASVFYEPHLKEKFNLDLISSNNYICHFMVMKRELIQKLRFRKEFEGAQDYDLVLRAVSELQALQDPAKEAHIRHIPKVLYHWRCHEASTAQNPRSKQYAYEAGRRAVQDFADRSGLHAKAEHLKHMGFYRLAYADAAAGAKPGKAAGMLGQRPDIGAIGGCLASKGRIDGGRMDHAGKALYAGLSVHDSGYMHKAVLAQDADAVDIRFLMVRRELWELFEEITGTPYRSDAEGWFAAKDLPPDTDCTALSLRLCSAVRDRGYRIAYLPELTRRNDEGI